jgi:hypothetical protein
MPVMRGLEMSGLFVAMGGGAKMERISLHGRGFVVSSRGIPRGEMTDPKSAALTGIASWEPCVLTCAPGDIPSGSSKRAREKVFSSNETICARSSPRFRVCIQQISPTEPWGRRARIVEPRTDTIVPVSEKGEKLEVIEIPRWGVMA